MIRLSGFKLITLAACISCAFAQRDTVWVRRLSGTGNSDDQVRAMTSDQQGNVYVVIQNMPSESTSAIITAKYSPSGELLWSQRSEGDGCVIPVDIAVDHWGNAFVTGSSIRPGGWLDIVTLKYGASGDSVWVKYYDAEGENDEASAVVVDDVGNAYVAGYGETGERYEDMALVKYSPSGEQLWARLFDFQENEDFGLAAVIDQQGYIYEVGTVCNWEAAGDFDMQVLKYSLDGVLQWARTFRGPGDNEDSAVAVALDPQNNLVVAGCTHPDFRNSGYLVVKYSPSGETLWSRSFVDQGDENGAVAVGTDNQANVILAGNDSNAYLVVKYSPTGTQLWRRSYHGPRDNDSLAGMQVDPSGNIYVSGWCERDWRGSDMTTVKYSPAGESVWVRRWVARDSLESGALALILAGSGICVGGYYNNRDLDENALLIRYDSGGNEQWSQVLNGPGTAGAGEGKDVTFDRNGNVIAAGWLENFDQYKDLAVAKYSASGELLWVQSYGNIPNEEDIAAAVQTDGWGNVYVTGYSEGAGTGLDYVTLKYDPWGNRLWANRYNGPADNDDKPVALAVDRSGNVAVTGESYGVGTDLDYATVRYSTSGQELWVRRYNGSADTADHAGAVAVDGVGATYVSGWSYEDDGLTLATTIKYDLLGDVVWTAHCEDPDSSLSSFRAEGMAVDSAGNVFLGGYGSRAFLAAKLSPSGETLWAARASFDRTCRAYSATGDETGRVLVTGRVRGSHDYDYATVAFSADGEELWRATFDSEYGRDYAYDVAVANDGNVFVTGRATYLAATVGYDSSGREIWRDICGSRGYAIAAGPENRIVVVGRDAGFVTILYTPEVGLSEPSRQASHRATSFVRVRPNPFARTVRFGGRLPGKGRVHICVYNRAGMLVRTLVDRAHSSEVLDYLWDGTDDSGHPVPNGVYFAEMTWVPERLHSASPVRSGRTKFVRLK